MKLSKSLERIATEIGGTVTDYDENTSIFIVPLNNQRFQTITCTIRQFLEYEHKIIEISSKVCAFSPKINCKELLEENTKFCHAKFSIVDNYIKVEGSAFVISAEDLFLKEILLEVAQVADDWEFKLTGEDNF